MPTKIIDQVRRVNVGLSVSVSAQKVGVGTGPITQDVAITGSVSFTKSVVASVERNNIPRWDPIPDQLFVKGIPKSTDISVYAKNRPVGSTFRLTNPHPGIAFNASSGILTYDGVADVSEYVTKAQMVTGEALQLLGTFSTSAGLPTGYEFEFGKHASFAYRPSEQAFYIAPADVGKFVNLDGITITGNNNAYQGCAVVKLNTVTNQFSFVHNRFGQVGEFVPGKPDGITWVWDTVADDGVYCLTGQSEGAANWQDARNRGYQVGTDLTGSNRVWKWNVNTGLWEHIADLGLNQWGGELWGGIYDPVNRDVLQQTSKAGGGNSFKKWNVVTQQWSEVLVNMSPLFTNQYTDRPTRRYFQCYDPVRREILGFYRTTGEFFAFSLDNTGPGGVRRIATIYPGFRPYDLDPEGEPPETVEALLVFIPSKRLLVFMDDTRMSDPTHPDNPNPGLSDGMAIRVINVETGVMRSYDYPQSVYRTYQTHSTFAQRTGITTMSNATIQQGGYCPDNDTVYGARGNTMYRFRVD